MFGRFVGAGARSLRSASRCRRTSANASDISPPDAAPIRRAITWTTATPTTVTGLRNSDRPHGDREDDAKMDQSAENLHCPPPIGERMPIYARKRKTARRTSGRAASWRRVVGNPSQLFLSGADGACMRFVDGFPNRARRSGHNLRFVFLGLFLLAIAALLSIGHGPSPLNYGQGLKGEIWCLCRAGKRTPAQENQPACSSPRARSVAFCRGQ